MSINNENNVGSNHQTAYSSAYREDRLGKTKKRKHGAFRTAMVILGYLAAVILIMYVVGLLTAWIDDRWKNEAKQMAVSAGAELMPEDRKVTLTEEELEARIREATEKAVAEAVAGAETEKEEALAQLQAEKEEAVASAQAEVLDGIKAGLETGDETMVEVLRPFYPDDIVLVSNGSFHFVPINRDLKLNSYNGENLNVLESGEYQYVEDGQVVTHKGIDVSNFQGKIDWNAVAGDGVEFAFIRMAYRGYGTGALVMDDTFTRNFEGARAAGIHVGVYIYSQAITEAEAVEEANLMLEKLAPYDVKCPIAFDVEKGPKATARMNLISVEERTNLALLFCQTIEAAGYKPMVYHNMEMGALMLDIETLEQYDKWFAYYNGDMYYPYDYKIWQYSDKGRVNGIGGNVDLNICFEPFWE